MSDYIKREDAIKAIVEYCIEDSEFDTDRWEYEAKGILADVPSADVVERKRGEWLRRKVFNNTDDKKLVIEEWQSAKCSICGKYHTTPYLYYFDVFRFCPNCGADMRERSGE